jgi:Mn-dependent DtxR family transcriptional regulator
VRAARTTVAADLAALFRARWEKASTAEQTFMAAMARLGDGPVARAALAAELGVSTTDLSVPRARLIDKGLIDATGRGSLTFTIPGFAAYIREHIGDPPG